MNYVHERFPIIQARFALAHFLLRAVLERVEPLSRRVIVPRDRRHQRRSRFHRAIDDVFHGKKMRTVVLKVSQS